MNPLKESLKSMLFRISSRGQETAVGSTLDQINTITALDRNFSRIAEQIERLGKLHASYYIDSIILSDGKYKDSKCLNASRGQVYSQNNEDGIISNIFEKIGVESRTFVEIAAGDGIENTSRLLLDQGWTGIWVEGGKKEVESIKHVAQGSLNDGRLQLINELITLENIDNVLINRIGFEPDYISVDIDYNTSHVWRKLFKLRPRLFCVEYNAHYPPSVSYEVPYKPDGVWDGTNRFGASLKALELIAQEHGYNLVGCDIFGVNAFFVRADLCSEEIFLAPFTSEQHYEPPRFDSVQMRGHSRHPNFE